MQKNIVEYEALIEAFQLSPYPTVKLNNYFQIYTDLFQHLIDSQCTFIEVGVLSGGSLFMWRKWLGNKARIIGIDLNPDALKWREFGFEVYIGDQGDPLFWQTILPEIGTFDVILDDGGHQSFQQVTTLNAAIEFSKNDCLVVIEDTCTSFMKDFAKHGATSFLEYAKSATDVITAKDCNFFPGQFPDFKNTQSINLFKNVHSIQFFSNIIAFHLRKNTPNEVDLIWNKESKDMPTDFRYVGKSETLVNWPDPMTNKIIKIMGGK